tara:strand:- start:885 stop:1118 length:234 start_codon:yes stop_codon:yes gene_type:complete
MNKDNIEDTVREVLDRYVGSQINIDSAPARDLLAKDIAAHVESELESDKLTQAVIEDSTAWSPPRRSQHVDGCGYDD